MRRRTRRELLGAIGFAAISAGTNTVLSNLGIAKSPGRDNHRPNVVLILTDNQGYGDLGCYGNSQVKTPVIDRLCQESARFSNFYVCALCSPTRATLMTGRYNYRTGVVDTSTGLAMLRPGEMTIANILAGAGYRTGIFGKWHLGDHYPLRPMDRGFQESLVNKDAIVAGIGNPPGNSLFHPVLQHNGQPEKFHGYITDISFQAATQFIEKNKDGPFFVYLPTNVVHEPLEVAEAYSAPYKTMGLDDPTAKLYGELTNLDENIGKLLATLRRLNLDDNTVLIFMSDNGMTGGRYNAGLRGIMGGLYEGGLKVPFLIRLPGKLRGAKNVDQIGAHIDVLPTLLEICRVAKPQNLTLDGVSLLPLITGNSSAWPDRTIFFQQSRPDYARRIYGDEPKLFTNCAARSQQYKIVMTAADSSETYIKPVGFEETQLYDLVKDPGETTDIARDRPDTVSKMRKQYEAWFRDVTRGIAPPVRNILGSRYENPVTLTSQDLRGPRSARGPHTLENARKMAEKGEPLGFGYWAVEVAQSGRYEITLRFGPPEGPKGPPLWSFQLKAGEAFLRIGEVAESQLVPKGATSVVFKVSLKSEKADVEAFITGQRENGIEVSPFFLDVKRLAS